MTQSIRCCAQSHLHRNHLVSPTGRAKSDPRAGPLRSSTQHQVRVRVMSCSMSSSSRLHTHAALLLALLVALASMAATVQSFVVPAARLSSAARRRTGAQGVRMMAVGPEGPWAAASTVMVAASQLIKDVPKTLLDMSEAATEAGAAAVAPYTNADGSFTNAAEVVEEVASRVEPDLPPPYYAVIFALALLVVSGLQQLSLGNVFDDEAKSAGSGGAVARRMNMRERSFFKKK